MTIFPISFGPNIFKLPIAAPRNTILLLFIFVLILMKPDVQAVNIADYINTI